MDAKLVGGSAWNVPVKGALVNIDEADVHAVLRSTGSLIKTLAIGGGIIIAAGLLSKIFSNSYGGGNGGYVPHIPRSSSLNGIECSLGGVTKIEFLRDNFYGVVLNEKIDFSLRGGNDVLNVPLDHINKIISYPHKKLLRITTVDGSEYLNASIKTNEIKLVTSVGIQSLPLLVKNTLPPITFLGFKLRPEVKVIRNREYIIRGVNYLEVKSIKKRLNWALSNNKKDIIDKIGTDVFSKYFTQDF